MKRFDRNHRDERRRLADEASGYGYDDDDEALLREGGAAAIPCGHLRNCICTLHPIANSGFPM